MRYVLFHNFGMRYSWEIPIGQTIISSSLQNIFCLCFFSHFIFILFIYLFIFVFVKICKKF